MPTTPESGVLNVRSVGGIQPAIPDFRIDVTYADPDTDLLIVDRQGENAVRLSEWLNSATPVQIAQAILDSGLARYIGRSLLPMEGA